MSWQLGALALLGVALAAGFAWYERARPDARIVALVGTLAGFAALGRIAFAAVPNVKPTTDIVLIAGYALGGGPGFAVGALAALTSNFFFGQGPWTPWQMAAWGATGMLGAGLALVTGRRINRWVLALACCGAGFAFTVVQDVGDWVTYSDHSTTQLGLYVGRGLGFDAVHAAGCLGFALAFGPALTRSVQRFSRRLQVRWITPDAIAPMLVALVATSLGAGLAGGFGGPAQAQAQARAASAAAGAAGANGRVISYLLGAQNHDGGFGSAPGQASAQLYSGWAALGLASAGYPSARVAHGGAGLISYVAAGAGSNDVGALERTILVVRAAGLSASGFGGRDLVAVLAHHRRADGSIGGQVNLTAFGILALRSAGAALPRRSYTWLASQQNRDGGFGFTGGATSDADDTGAALEALAGAPGLGAARARAVAYLRGAQNRDGGFTGQAGLPSNAQSTAWGIQGLDAAGVAPASLHRHGAVSPLAYLRGLIAADGSVRYSRGLQQTPVWVTAEALMALEGKPLPLAAVAAPAASPAPSRRAAATRRRNTPSTRARTQTGTSPAPANPGPKSRSGHQAGASGTARGPMAGLVAALGIVTAIALAPLNLN
ncbi:MAG: prenyltransferase/squalene oxidase repeat-containing protein [Solirubrobacteraceae bacterium]